MPSWKRLIVSGSDANLSSLSVDNSISAASLSGSFSGSFDGSGATLTFGTFGSANEVLLVGANKTITSSDIFTINVDQRTVSADSFLGSFSGSFIGDGSQLNNVAVFPYTGSAVVTGSIDLTGNANIIGGANFDVFATPQTASGDSIITDGYYAKMFGPVLVSGTVTVGTGSILKVEPF